jgi:hypothetical protein
MTIARAYHPAPLLPHGRVLITGGTGNLTGISNEKGITPIAELYDPATGKQSLPSSIPIFMQSPLLSRSTTQFSHNCTNFFTMTKIACFACVA